MFYAKSTGGFYDEAIHGARRLSIVQPSWEHPLIEVADPAFDPAAHPAGTAVPMIRVPDPAIVPPTVEINNPDCMIPADAVEITAAEHAALLDGQSAGKLIQADASGLPILADPPPPTVEELEAAARAERDRRISADIDTINAVRWAAMTSAQQSAWTAYRQALLGVPEQSGFPMTITWPVAPQ